MKKQLMLILFKMPISLNDIITLFGIIPGLVQFFREPSTARTVIFWVFAILSCIFLLQLISIFLGYTSFSFFPINYELYFWIENYNNALPNETIDFTFAIDEANRDLHFRVDFFFMSKDSNTMPILENYSNYLDVTKEEYSKVQGKIKTSNVKKGRFYLCVLLEDTKKKQKIIECDTSPFIIKG